MLRRKFTRSSWRVFKNSHMDKLNLPIIKQAIAEPRSLSMGEYLEFVNFNLKYTVDREASRNWKKKLFVDVRFFFK